MSQPSLSKIASFRQLSDLFRYLRPYRSSFIAALLASMVSMGFGALFPYLVGHLIDSAVPSIKAPPVQAWRPSLNTAALVLIGTLAVQAILTFFASLAFQQAGERAVVDLRKETFGRLLTLPMRFFNERRVGELSSRLSNDLAQVQDLFAFAIPQIIRQSTLFLFGCVFIVATSWRLSLVMMLSFPVLIILGIVVGRGIRKLAREAQDRLAETATIVEETLHNIASVKSYTSEAYERQRYASGLAHFLEKALPAARFRAGLIAFVIFGIFGSVVLVLWFGARLMQAGELTHGEFTRFTLFTVLIGGSVAAFAEVFATLNRTLGASQRIREILAETPEPVLPASPSTRLQGGLAFADVEFRYPSRPELPVLRGLSLRAAPGEKIALVGPSGAGKSTIVSLLLRFYEPDAGRVLLDGIDAATINLANLRDSMAIVPQEVLLFGGSIRENIAYGKPSASDEEILSAARRAHCLEFIDQFPEGLQTLVGERGVKLSGGQRQRIAIARAFLRDPAILILDEATSSLDAESESLIQEALTTLLAGRTAVIIAHRLATIRRVDRIYVIESGVITEEGTHAELASREGTYSRLAALQFQH